MSGRKIQEHFKGFTLVELSIVIVIIGFLVAGIAGASSMIEQARIRSVITDLSSLTVAYNTFKAKYNNIPGDMATAESYWPIGTCGNDAGDCTGNADGSIQSANTIGGTGGDEVRPALKELALAGLISIGGPTLTAGTVPILRPGVNAPASKIAGVGYYFTNVQGFNAISIGRYDPTNASGSGLLDYGALTPLEAFIIDQKIDDGTATSNGVLTGWSTGNIEAGQAIDYYVLTDFSTYYRCIWYNGGYNANFDQSSCLIVYLLK